MSDATVSDESYIGEQAAVKCPDCGHETAMLGVEEIPHAVLPISVPLNRCWTCGFTYTDYKAEEAESAYIARYGWPIQEQEAKQS